MAPIQTFGEPAVGPLVERFTRTDFDTLQYDVTIEDPGAYTRPWSTGWTLKWVGGQELPAHFCQDNRP